MRAAGQGPDVRPVPGAPGHGRVEAVFVCLIFFLLIPSPIASQGEGLDAAVRAGCGSPS